MNAVVGALSAAYRDVGRFLPTASRLHLAQASVLNRMVLLYALPLMLFAGMVTIMR